MRRSNIHKTSQGTGGYICYTKSGCTYSTNNYEDLKHHMIIHEKIEIAEKIKGSKNIFYYNYYLIIK